MMGETDISGDWKRKHMELETVPELTKRFEEKNPPKTRTKPSQGQIKPRPASMYIETKPFVVSSTLGRSYSQRVRREKEKNSPKTQTKPSQGQIKPLVAPKPDTIRRSSSQRVRREKEWTPQSGPHDKSGFNTELMSALENRRENIQKHTNSSHEHSNEVQDWTKLNVQSYLPVIVDNAQFSLITGNDQETSVTQGAIFHDNVESTSAQDIGMGMEENLGLPHAECLQPVSTVREIFRVCVSWTGTEPNCLTISQGELVSVLYKHEDNEYWWGEIHGNPGKVGWFPATYVKEEPESWLPVTPQEPSEIFERIYQEPSHPYLAICDFCGEFDGDLSFSKGSIINVIQKEGKWWRGECNGKRGDFRCEYVNPSPMETSHVDSVSVPSRGYRKIGRVIADFTAKHEGHISLSPRQYVFVDGQEGDWCTGQIVMESEMDQCVSGCFPADCIDLLTSASKLSPKSSTPISSNKKKCYCDRVFALYSYETSSTKELTFLEGSFIDVLSKETSDLWKGELNDEVGLFPSSHVQSVDKLEKFVSTLHYLEPGNIDEVICREKNRRNAIFELVNTEKNFVCTLEDVNEVFFIPMTTENLLSEELSDKIIGNWDELIICNSDLCNALFKKLRTSRDAVPNIGDVLQYHIPRLVPHVEWCSNVLEATTILRTLSDKDDHFIDFEDRCKKDDRIKDRIKQMPLSSFLITPLQRITKYPILIEKILKYTSSTDAEYGLLQSALQEAKDLCSIVNGIVHQQENCQKLEWLQRCVYLTLDEKLVFNSETKFMGQRYLLHSGRVEKIHKNKKMYAFLFNDFFLLVKSKTAGKVQLFSDWCEAEFKVYKEPFLLSQITAKHDRSDDTTFIMTLTKDIEGVDIPLRVKTNSAREKWVKQINDACVHTKGRNPERRSNRHVALKTNLTVTVVEAADLPVTSNENRNLFCVVGVVEVTSKKNQERATPNFEKNFKPYEMKFFVSNPDDTVLKFTVFTRNRYSSNGFLGSAELSLKQLKEKGPGPWNKHLQLENTKGVLQVRIACQ